MFTRQSLLCRFLVSLPGREKGLPWTRIPFGSGFRGHALYSLIQCYK